MRDMTAAQADGDGNVDFGKGSENDIVQQAGGRAGRNAVEHFTEDDAVHSVELAGGSQLPEHPIDLVGLDAGVFKEQKLAFHCGLPRCAEERNENAEATTVKNAARSAGLECAQTFAGAKRIGLAGQRSAQTCKVDSVVCSKITCDHGAVKGWKTE